MTSPLGTFFLGFLLCAALAWLWTMRLRSKLERTGNQSAYYHTLYARLLQAVMRGDEHGPDWQWGRKAGKGR